MTTASSRTRHPKAGYRDVFKQVERRTGLNFQRVRKNPEIHCRYEPISDAAGRCYNNWDGTFTLYTDPEYIGEHVEAHEIGHAWVWPTWIATKQPWTLTGTTEASCSPAGICAISKLSTIYRELDIPMNICGFQIDAAAQAAIFGFASDPGLRGHWGVQASRKQLPPISDGCPQTSNSFWDGKSSYQPVRNHKVRHRRRLVDRLQSLHPEPHEQRLQNDLHQGHPDEIAN